MDFNQLERDAEELLRARYDHGLGAVEAVAETTQLLQRVHGAPGMELLSYRLRLMRIQAAYEVWPAAQYVQEAMELSRIYSAHVPHYPVHPMDSSERASSIVGEALIGAVDKLAMEPVVNRDELEHALAHLIYVMPLDSAVNVLRARAYQRAGLTKQAHNFIVDGFIPGVPDENWDRGKGIEWAQWLLLAIRSDLERGDLAGAEAKVEQLEAVGGFTDPDYLMVLADTLIPLATVVDAGTTLARMKTVLVRGMGVHRFTLATLRVATFLVKSGLVEEGLSLAEQTDQGIIRPELAVAELAVFFDAVGRAGHGERPVVQYTSPRWQVAAGVDPADPRCGTLAQAFARATVRPVPPWLVNYDLPQLPTGAWEDTIGVELRRVDTSSPCFDPVDKQYAPELVDYMRSVIEIMRDEGAYEDRPPLPSIYDREDIAALRKDLHPHNDPVLITAAMEAIARIVDDPAEDDALRTILAFDLLEEAQPETVNMDMDNQAMRALPVLANLGPDLAVFMALKLAHFRVYANDFEGEPLSPLLTYVSALTAGGDIDERELYSTPVMYTLGRKLDTVWLGRKQLSHLLLHPERYDDPADAQFQVLRMLIHNANQFEDWEGSVGFAGRAMDVADSVGNEALVADLRGQQALTYLRMENLGPAMQLFIDHTPQPEMPARVAFPMAAVGVQALSTLGGELFDDYWPSAYSQFMRSTEELIRDTDAEDFNDPDHHILDMRVDDAVRCVVRETMWNLIDTGRSALAAELTGWAVQVSKPLPDPVTRAELMFFHAIAVDDAGDQEQAAPIYEVAYDSMLGLADEGKLNVVRKIVLDRAEETGSQALADVARRMQG